MLLSICLFCLVYRASHRQWAANVLPLGLFGPELVPLSAERHTTPHRHRAAAAALLVIRVIHNTCWWPPRHPLRTRLGPHFILVVTALRCEGMIVLKMDNVRNMDIIKIMRLCSAPTVRLCVVPETPQWEEQKTKFRPAQSLKMTSPNGFAQMWVIQKRQITHTHTHTHMYGIYTVHTQSTDLASRNLERRIMTASQVLCFSCIWMELNLRWMIPTMRSISLGEMGRVRDCSLSRFITCVVNSLHAWRGKDANSRSGVLLISWVTAANEIFFEYLENSLGFFFPHLEKRAFHAKCWQLPASAPSTDCVDDVIGEANLWIHWECRFAIWPGPNAEWI